MKCGYLRTRGQSWPAWEKGVFTDWHHTGKNINQKQHIIYCRPIYLPTEVCIFKCLMYLQVQFLWQLDAFSKKQWHQGTNVFLLKRLCPQNLDCSVCMRVYVCVWFVFSPTCITCRLTAYLTSAPHRLCLVHNLAAFMPADTIEIIWMLHVCLETYCMLISQLLLSIFFRVSSLVLAL